MATEDLTNPIPIPNGIDTANENPVAKSEKIIRQGQGHDVEVALTRLENANISWDFNNTVLTAGADPGLGKIGFNAATRTATTTISIHAQSGFNDLRVDEILADLETNDKLLLQQANAPERGVLFELTGVPVSQGSFYEIPVVERRVQGLEFDNNAKLNSSIFTASVSGGSISADQQAWLAQTSSQEISSTAVTNIAASVEDVLIWRRAAIVTNSIINDAGTGLRIDEANRQSDGTFDRPSGTAVYDDDLANAYIYIGITTTDFTGLDAAATFFEARRGGVLVFSSSLADLTTPSQVSSGQFTYRRTTNNQYHYVDGDTMEVVTRATSSTTQYNYTSPAGDFTANVTDLPFTSVDADFAGRVNGPSDNQEFTASDTVKLAGLEVSTSTTAGQNVTVLYKEGTPSGDIADYTGTWNASNPVLANFGATRVLSILVDNNTTITSVSGGATLGPQLQWIPRKYIYQVTLPAEAGSGTPTSHLPVGTVETFLPTGFNSNYKIERDNVEQNLLNQIDQHGSGSDISSLETKVDALFPLTPDVDILVNWANIYDPIHGAADVDIVNGYSLIADHRSSLQKYESGGVTFGTGTNVITYTGLSDNLHRSFGFALPQTNTVTLTGTSGTANITVNGVAYLVTFATSPADLTTTASDFVTSHATALSTAGVTVTSDAAVLTFVSSDPSVLFTISDAVNATGDLAGTEATAALADKTLMWIVDGGTTIPFVDITAAGNIRVNNYTPSETSAQLIDNQVHFLTKQSGPATVSQGSGNQRFALPNFPSGSTNRSRILEISPEIFVNGVDTGASGFDPAVNIPTTNTAQALQTVEHTFQLGPLHGNRTVSVTTGYEFIVDGPDLDVRLTVESAPSDVSVNFEGNTAAYLDYTAQNIVARVDNFLNLTDAGGDYTFTGQQEFILSMRPVIGGDGEQTGYLEVVPAAVGSNGVIDQLNDTNIRIPTPLWDGIEVADDIGFKTFVADHYFVHSEVAGLLQHRTERWAYGLARLQTVNAGHSITEAVDLASGSTIGGSPIGPGTVQAEVVVYEATGKGTGAGELVSSVVLPSDYGNYKYIHVTEYDVTNLQFRHAEIPTYIFTAGLVDSNDNVRLQGNTVMSWTAGTRTLAMNPVAQEILRVTLKD